MTDRPPTATIRPTSRHLDEGDDELLVDDEGRRRRTTTAYDDEYDDGYELEHDDEYVERARASRRAAGASSRSSSCCCSCFGIAGGAAALWVQRQIDPPGAPGEPQELVIPEGSTSDDIGKLLAAEGIISSDFVWEWYLRINGGGPVPGRHLRAGREQRDRRRHRRRSTPVRRRSRSARFTVPEALTAQGDPRPARRPRGGARLRSRQAPGADGQRPDPLVGPAGRPAVERGDPVPRDVPHRGRRRRGGRAPQAGRRSSSR